MDTKTFDLGDVNQVAQTVAAKLGVSPALHPEDYLLRFIVQRHGPEKGTAAYFNGGRHDANQIVTTLRRFRVPVDRPISMLEFASGFGRVTRHLVNILPSNCKLVSADIHPEACRFLHETLSVSTIQSTQSAEDLVTTERFAAVFVLSLFSHLPEHSFGRWLRALYELVEPGGALLFTTHGEFALRQSPAFYTPIYDRSRGCGFAPVSDQDDLDPTEYGSMIAMPRFVIGEIEKIPGARLASFSSGTWLGIQDEWTVRRPSVAG